MQVLVTGGHGFIGRHVVAALQAHGFAVRCMHRQPAPPDALAELGAEAVRGDLRDPSSLDTAVRGCTHVVHLAGLTRSLTRRALWSTNVAGTLALFDAAAAAGLPGRFVFCSSQAARGPSATCQPLTEGDATSPPLSWYGASKQAAERVLAHRPGPARVILRPPAVYGPHDRDFLSLFQAVARGLAPMVGDPDACYSLVYAPDLAAAFVAALAPDRPEIPAGPYFVCHPQVVRNEAMMAAAEAAVGRQTRRLRVPASTGRLLGRFTDVVSQVTGQPSLMGSQRMRELVAQHWVCAPNAYEEATGWRAGVEITEGFARTVAWYRTTGLLRERGV